MNEEELIKRKILDTANKAFNHNIYTYTGFLSLSELSVYYNMKKDLNFIASKTFGGAPLCERQMIQFGSEDDCGYPGYFPISVIKVSPLTPKFAEENNHRDYLGALMNLGIERSLIGDIKIDGKEAYIFVSEHIAEFIIENLTSIRHTHVKCELTNEMINIEPDFLEFQVIAASKRADAVVAAITKLPRSKAVELFRSSKIFINGLCCENNSCQLKPDDILVIRGTGKFIFESAGNETRKGRVYITLRKYV